MYINQSQKSRDMMGDTILQQLQQLLLQNILRYRFTYAFRVYWKFISYPHYLPDVLFLSTRYKITISSESLLII